LVLASDYPFMDILWTMVIFFAWVCWIWMMIALLSNIFQRPNLSGWGKAAWTIFLICLPFLGALIYLIVAHDELQLQGQRQVKAYENMQRGAAISATEEIQKAKTLLDSGTISQTEFDSLKTQALAGGVAG